MQGTSRDDVPRGLGGDLDAARTDVPAAGLDSPEAQQSDGTRSKRCVAELEAELAGLRLEMLDADRRLVELARDSAELHLLREELAAVYGSKSWQVTAPLRSRLAIIVAPPASRALRLLGHCLYGWRSPASRRLSHDGWAGYKRLKASGLFDAGFYLETNRDVAAEGLDPLAHYLGRGAAEARDPNPLFDTAFYLKANPTVTEAAINPLYHYLTAGARDGCNPNPLFDTLLYAQDLGDRLAADRTSLGHFLSDPSVRSGLARLLASGKEQWGWTEYRQQLVRSTFCYTTERKSRLADAPDTDDGAAAAIVIAAPDAESSDTQRLVLAVAGQLAQAPELRIFVLLQRGGPLVRRFLALAPTVVLEDEAAGQPAADEGLDDLVRILQARSADAALCYGSLNSGLIERFASHGVRVVTAIHDLPSSLPDDSGVGRLRETCAHSDHVIYPARFVREHLESSFSLSPRSASVHPPGLLQRNPFVNEREFARFEVAKQLQLPASAIIVLSGGATSPPSGFDLFKEVAQTLRPRTADAEVHFVWLGNGDSDVNATDREEAALWGLGCDGDLGAVVSNGADVHVLNRQPYSGLFCAAADVFILASREPLFPNFCLEAMEAGVPVVAFESAGEVVGNDAGLLVPDFNAGAMAAAVDCLLANAALRSRLGAAGKQRVKERFQLHDYIQRVMDLLQPGAQRVKASTDRHRLS